MKLFKKVLAVLGVFYLLNPGWGVVEFIPDGIPVVGNLDEAAILYWLLRYLGFQWPGSGDLNPEDGIKELQERIRKLKESQTSEESHDSQP